MKKLILFMFVTSLSCKAQLIMSIEDYRNCKNTNTCQKVDYIKDINGSLNKFIGTWKETYDNITYEIVVTKYTRSHKIGNIKTLKIDALFLRYKITNNNGVVIADTKSYADDSYYVAKGSSFSDDGSYKLHFKGIDNNMKNEGTILLKLINNKLDFFFYPDRLVLLKDEKNYFPDKPYTFPSEKSIFLIKQ